MEQLKRLIAPRFLVTMTVIFLSSYLLFAGRIDASVWLTAVAGAGGIYSFSGASTRDLRKELDP